MGELYATRIRVTGYSAGVVAQRVANAAAPALIGFLLAHEASFSATVAILAAGLPISALLCLLLPETEGHDLA